MVVKPNEKDETDKGATVAEEVPVFRNRTKIDQVVYDHSYSSITVPSGKTVKGEWFRRYANGKRNCAFVLVDKTDKPGKKEGVKDDKDKNGTDSKSAK